MIWENEFSGARAESEDPPGPGWVEVPDPDVILSANERETLPVQKIKALLKATLDQARQELEYFGPISSIESIAMKTRTGQARISLLREILRRLGEV